MDAEFNDNAPMENAYGDEFEEREDEEPVPIVDVHAQDEDAGDAGDAAHSQVSYQE